MIILGKKCRITFRENYSLKLYDLSDGTVRERTKELAPGDSIVFLGYREDIDGIVGEIDGSTMDGLVPEFVETITDIEYLPKA